MTSFQPVKKATRSLPPMAANKVQCVFCRGAPQGGLSCSFGAIHLLYLAENTSQVASVEFAPPLGGKLCTQQTAKVCRKSPRGFSDSLKGGLMPSFLLHIRRKQYAVVFHVLLVEYLQ